MRKNISDTLQLNIDKLKDAHWIGGAGNVFCRKRFTLNSEIALAQLWIIADAHSYLNEFYPKTENDELPANWLLGGSFLKYRLFINAEQIGAGPVRAITTGLPVVQCFDVTQYLTITDNVIGIISRGEKRGVGLMLHVEYTNGEQYDLTTDSSWRIYNGNDVFKPVCWEYQSLYSFINGNPGPGEWPEHIDGKNFPDGWLDHDFDDSNWKPAQTFGAITQQYEIDLGTNYEIKRIAPQHIRKLAAGEYLIDFGREVVGGIEMSIPVGEQERIVELRLGEELLDDGRVRFQMRTGNRYQEKWTFSGNGEKLAHFGVRAFRYAEVINWPGELAPTSICAVAVNAPFNWNDSSFSCSDAALKKVWDFCKYSIAATSMDVYMDCPSRERLAYEADSYVTMLTHFSVESNIALAKRTFEYQLSHSTWPCEWRQLSIPLAYEYLMHTGDYDCIEKYYDHLKNNCSFHQLIDQQLGLIKEFPMRILIDWPPVYRNGYDEKEYTAIPNALAYYNFMLLNKLALLLNKTHTEADYWLQLAEKIKIAFNNLLFDEKSGLYRDSKDSTNCSFHTAMYALRFGLVPADKISTSLDFIIEKGMICSPYTAQFYLETLFIHNQAEFAVKLMTADSSSNSWLGMIAQGATATMESWTPEHKPNLSWAHPWATAPANIIARYLFGLRPTVPGWEKYSFEPAPGGIKSGELTIPTPRGKINATFNYGKEGYKTASNFIGQ